MLTRVSNSPTPLPDPIAASLDRTEVAVEGDSQNPGLKEGEIGSREH